MNRLLGTKVEVNLRNNEGTVSGVLFDMDNEYVYLQNDVSTFITVPKSNVSFYVSSSSQSTALVEAPSAPPPAPLPPPSQVWQPEPIEPLDANCISVKINDVVVATVDIPSDMNIGTCSAALLDLVYENQEVKAALMGRTQVSMEYDIGEVDITTADAGHSGSNLGDDFRNKETGEVNSFSMSSGGASAPQTQFEMLQTLSGEKNG